MKLILVVEQAYEIELPDNVSSADNLFDHLPNRDTWKETGKPKRRLFEPNQYKYIR